MFKKERPRGPIICQTRVNRVLLGDQEISPEDLALEVWQLGEHMKVCDRLEPHRITVVLVHHLVPGLDSGTSTVHLSGGPSGGQCGQMAWQTVSTTRPIGTSEILIVSPHLGDKIRRLQLDAKGLLYTVNLGPAPRGWDGF